MTDDYNPVPLEIVGKWILVPKERWEAMKAEAERMKARLAEIEAGVNADARDLETPRDGTKLNRAGLVSMIVYQRQDIEFLRARIAELEAGK